MTPMILQLRTMLEKAIDGGDNMSYKQAWYDLKNNLLDAKKDCSRFNKRLANSYINRIVHQMDKYEEVVEQGVEIDEDYEFRGYDYTELLEKFCLNDYIPDDKVFGYQDLDPALKMGFLKSFLWSNIENEDVVNECRDFLEKNSELSASSVQSVFESIEDIEDDTAFMQFFIQFIDMMWV